VALNTATAHHLISFFSTQCCNHFADLLLGFDGARNGDDRHFSPSLTKTFAPKSRKLGLLSTSLATSLYSSKQHEYAEIHPFGRFSGYQIVLPFPIRLVTQLGFLHGSFYSQCADFWQSFFLCTSNSGWKLNSWLIKLQIWIIAECQHPNCLRLNSL